MRKCLKCWLEKPLEDYYKHPFAKWGRMTSCKVCKKSYQRIKQDKAYDRMRYRKNPRRRLNVIFRWINQRCNTVSSKRYHRYWWRWVKNLWVNFEEFYTDMLESYVKHREKHKNDWGKRHTTIERIDNDWHYCKENCKWATYKEQARNTSRVLH